MSNVWSLLNTSLKGYSLIFSIFNPAQTEYQIKPAVSLSAYEYLV